MSQGSETPMTEQSRNLTPPCTPPPYHAKDPAIPKGFDRQKTPSISDSKDNARGDTKAAVTPTAEETLSWDMISPQSCTKRYQLSGSLSSGYEEFGQGAWSTVYRAIETSETSPSIPLTPPGSPVTASGKPATNRVLAIKAPARKDAHDVLYHEARILTYLHSSRCASAYVVAFHGYDATSKSFVMDANPLNLETHAKDCLKNVRANFSTRTMFDPVCGPQEWQSLATQLIDGLDFLHSNNCIHGDIKPSNILLRPKDDGSSSSVAYTPLYCDFSSSRIYDDSTISKPKETQQITALTSDYASPELLTSLQSTAAIATTAADVYALAVSLVVVAIGTSPYAGAGMEMLKLSMARQGRVLEFARQADQGTRIMKGRMVERCLKDALAKDVGRRCTAKEWRCGVQAVLSS